MFNTVCWYCKTDFEYDGEQYRDVNCPHCGVLNSIMNPDKSDWKPEIEPTTTEEVWLNQEEEMLNYNDEKYQGKYIYLPKVGETAEFDIKELREVESDNPKFNFTENVPVMANGEQVVDDDGELVTKKKDLGYHIEAELQNEKILHVGSMAAFINVFKKHTIVDGDHIKVEHPEKGVWKVTKL